MFRHFVLLLPCVWLTVAAADLKPFDAKLGLWESTANIEMDGMPQNLQMPKLTPEQLAQMPPAQRAQFEAMAKNGGSLTGPHTSRSCATRESLSRGLGMGEGKEANCSRQIVSSSPAKAEIHIECTPKGATEAKSVGDMIMERVDTEHIRGNMTMRTTAGAKTVNMKITFTSKWISSGCGDVLPAGTH